MLLLPLYYRAPVGRASRDPGSLVVKLCPPDNDSEVLALSEDDGA